MNASVQALQDYLAGLPPGSIDDSVELSDVLAEAWNSLTGSDEGGMEAYKVRGRMEYTNTPAAQGGELMAVKQSPTIADRERTRIDRVGTRVSAVTDESVDPAARIVFSGLRSRRWHWRAGSHSFESTARATPTTTSLRSRCRRHRPHRALPAPID